MLFLMESLLKEDPDGDMHLYLKKMMAVFLKTKKILINHVTKMKRNVIRIKQKKSN
jgi:hypothetical protein